jgi:hypothetical protein
VNALPHSSPLIRKLDELFDRERDLFNRDESEYYTCSQNISNRVSEYHREIGFHWFPDGAEKYLHGLVDIYEDELPKG